MERAIKGLVTGRYEWVAFTSRNAVKAVRERFEEYGLDARAFAGIKVAAVGEQTAADLLAWGIKPDLVPSGEQSAAGLLEDWPPYDAVFDPIDRVFLPRADIATENLVAGLVERGWEVDDVTAYRTVRAAPPAAPIREAIKSGGYDAVVFTSSSTVRNLVGIAGKPHPSTVIACIGPATAKTAEEHGLRVDVLAPSPSVPRPGRGTVGVRRVGCAPPPWPPGSRCCARRRSAPPPAARPRSSMSAWPPLGLPPGRRGRGGCAPRRRCGRWSRRPGPRRLTWCCRCSSARAWAEPHRSPRCPGVVQHSRDSLRKAAVEAVQAGVGGLMLFGVPSTRDATGTGATDEEGFLNVAIRDVVAEVGDATVVMSDLCLDEFTDQATAACWTPTASSTMTRRWCGTPRWGSRRPRPGPTSSGCPG